MAALLSLGLTFFAPRPLRIPIWFCRLCRRLWRIVVRGAQLSSAVELIRNRKYFAYQPLETKKYIVYVTDKQMVRGKKALQS